MWWVIITGTPTQLNQSDTIELSNVRRIRTMSAIQISLSTDEWLLLSRVSRGKGMLPPEYLRDLLMKDLERNYLLRHDIAAVRLAHPTPSCTDSSCKNSAKFPC